MSTELFYIVPDAFIVLRRKGVYRQAQIYHRAGRVYAKFGGGFVRLMREGTTVPDLMWEGDLPKIICLDSTNQPAWPRIAATAVRSV